MSGALRVPLPVYVSGCWENGCIDWHPEVVNNLAIFLSGELELEPAAIAS